ncbi:hypothetical protein [Mesorhizobium sp. CAU 1741]|uniref:hypothetical protein n=1 Tax=Mesorhizobium sp. CAU 1741 TaxID=3140366 RepID=UPI00325A6DAD
MGGTIDPFDAVIIAVAAIVVWALLSRLYRGRAGAPPLSKPEAEHRFATVFGLTPIERQEALISHYMAKHRCSRREAMDIAMEARHTDEEHW